MVGIRTATASSTDPLEAVRALAEAGANARGASLVSTGLRLFDGIRAVPARLDLSDANEVSAFSLGRAYELALAPATRRRSGAHLTPESIARQLVGLLATPPNEATVLDPSVGGGAFLLAAADQLVASGVDAHKVRAQLHGVDIDPGAVAVAEAALALWGLDHGLEPEPLDGMVVGDGLLDDLPSVDYIVGNPPFLNQLRSASSHTADRRSQLRERWGALVGAYTDDAWLFIAAALAVLNPAGSLAMVQPVSLLAARHAAGVREHVSELASLDALWVARDRVFDAAVQVCGIVATKREISVHGSVTPASSIESVDRFVGASFDQCARLDEQPTSEQWGSAASVALGVPPVSLLGTATAGDLASATAGFRDQFYGFVPHVSEAPAGTTLGNSGTLKLVTVGMIDVLTLHWGHREFKFAKQPYERPILDLESVRETDRSLAE